MNKQKYNPFDFDGAKNLEPELLLEWFIDDNNNARFIQSTRNVILFGHRGCGKSMNLLYFSLPIERLKKDATNDSLLKNIGIYVPCNTPLAHRVDHEYLNDKKLSQALSEHYFTLGIAVSISDTLNKITDLMTPEDFSEISDELSYVINEELPKDNTLFRTLKKSLNLELREIQEKFSGLTNNFNFSSARTLYTLVIPILNALKCTKTFTQSHFSLMIDDAQDLNNDQKLLLNSWLSYRDHSVFSFKIALAANEDFNRKTSSGGSIIEGHDYTSINLEQPFQNEHSKFGQLARDIIQKRLEKIDIAETTPEKFFLESPLFVAELDKCKGVIRDEYISTHPEASTKSINDHVYKYARARYFQNRHAKANRPTYSGIETLIHLSTGVIRNLLLPCYWMYDDMQSKLKENETVTFIPPNIQSDVIIKKSEDLWTRIRDGLDKELDTCSKEQATQIHNLVTALGDRFRDRLLNHKSEPRIVTFIIAKLNPSDELLIKPLFTIMRKAQILYRRSGPSKDEGRQDDLYTLNRLLWPARGLDPQGQAGRLSITSTDIVHAMNYGRLPPSRETKSDNMQEDLFDV